MTPHADSENQVVNCANVFASPEKALPIYGAQRLQWMDDAMNALIWPDPLRRDFFAHERMVRTLHGAVKLIRLNRTRADFAEKFEALIGSVNAGSRSIEEMFEELLARSRSLDDGEQRHVRENLSEEELVVLDILTRPGPELTIDERAEVNKMARDLLVRLKAPLVLNWRQKSAARAQLKLAIEDALDAGLPRAYTPEICQQKCSAVFEHLYESYPRRDVGLYAVGG